MPTTVARPHPEDEPESNRPSDSETPAQQAKDEKPARQPLSPVARKRLQKMFEHGSKQSGQEQYDYAHELLSQCVVGDPTNLQYAQTFLGNLRKKYKNNRKGSSLAQFKERGARSAIKKALGAENWDDVFKNGVAVLRVNPWDIPALTAMAEAAKQIGARDCELFYLKSALEADPKSIEINKLCAKALEERQQFDQAIACLRRAEQAAPEDEEIKRWIGDLTVRKTIVIGGYEGDPAKKQQRIGGISAVKAGAARADDDEELSPEQRAKQKIRQEPKNLENYYELAQVYLNDDRYEDAEKVFARALEISGGDPDVRDKWEDCQLRRARAEAARAKKLRDTDPAAEELYQQKRRELNKKELEVARNRVDRYPGQLRFKYDLGLRYQINQQYAEAIKFYQMARNDPRVKGMCLLHLGQCFQQIKQYRLAMNHYALAIEEIPDRDADNKKEALYLAGKMALYLRDVETAERYLTTLAGLDFTYKDVSKLLDQIARIHDSQGEVTGEEMELPEASDVSREVEEQAEHT